MLKKKYTPEDFNIDQFNGGELVPEDIAKELAEVANELVELREKHGELILDNAYEKIWLENLRA